MTKKRGQQRWLLLLVHVSDQEAVYTWYVPCSLDRAAGESATIWGLVWSGGTDSSPRSLPLARWKSDYDQTSCSIEEQSPSGTANRCHLQHSLPGLSQDLCWEVWLIARMQGQGTSTRCQKWKHKHLGNSRARLAGAAQLQQASGNDLVLKSVPPLQTNPRIVAHSPAAQSNEQRTRLSTTYYYICSLIRNKNKEQ